MRIANSMLYRQVLDALQQQTRGQFEAQQAISSGLRFERAGEDPVAMAGVLRQQDANARLAAYASNAVVVESRLRQSELGLDALNDTLQAARETLLRAQSDALNSADRATLAAELRRRRHAEPDPRQRQLRRRRRGPAAAHRRRRGRRPAAAAR